MDEARTIPKPYREVLGYFFLKMMSKNARTAAMRIAYLEGIYPWLFGVTDPPRLVAGFIGAISPLYNRAKELGLDTDFEHAFRRNGQATGAEG